MGLVQLYSSSESNTTDDMSTTPRCLEKIKTFCNCNQDTDRQQHPNQSENVVKIQPKCTLSIVPKQMLDLPKSSKFIRMPVDVCRCGEDTCQTIEWTWDANFAQPQTIIDNNTVLFHPYYSQGTSIVRGSEPLQCNMIHYFEVKIVHWFSGTDLMVGIGTDQVNLLEYQYRFVSVLGLDDQSWGFSHRGMIQHKNLLKYYGKSYTKQCIIGVYLDLSRGLLEFYVNRIPQGIAFRNIPLDKSLYEMVCSTSAKSSVRLINTTSFRDCLQFRCMKIITKYPQLLDKVQNIPGLASLCRDVWFMFPKERYQYTTKSSDPVENNYGAQMSKCPEESPTVISCESADSIDDLNTDAMDVIDESGGLAENASQPKASEENIDDAIFLSTFDKNDVEMIESEDDDVPIYDDED